MMCEIRMHGRFGQPVGKLAGVVGQFALEQGKHVQIINSFAAFRPGGPTYTAVRTDDAPIRERAANNLSPDVVIVLDNSLFSNADVTKGLKVGGTVMALGVDRSVLGTKAGDYDFVALDPFIKGSGMSDIEAGLISCLKMAQVF